MMYKFARGLLALTVSLATAPGCVSSRLNSRDSTLPEASLREPASTSTDLATSLHLVPIAGNPARNAALFINITPDQRRFTVTECLANKKAGADEFVLETAQCATLLDKWIPLREETFRARFGEAFALAMDERLAALGHRRDSLQFIGNLFAGLSVGFTAYGLVMKEVIPRFAIGGPTARLIWILQSTAVLMGVGSVVALESKFSSLRYYDLNQEIARKSFLGNQARLPIASPDDYAATKASLVDALQAQQLL